ncbi:hypothetical protein COPEUT_02746 [Coprococcus eutactus ATCC 27759]|nr:hypothetical protein COPEUT_02746 [Coprococcus eutactus ATCC 27759]
MIAEENIKNPDAVDNLNHIGILQFLCFGSIPKFV